MPSLNTGDYLLRHYNRYGQPLKQYDQLHRCLTEAQEAGVSALGNDDITSFTVDRRLFNSLDERKAWMTRNEERSYA